MAVIAFVHPVAFLYVAVETGNHETTTHFPAGAVAETEPSMATVQIFVNAESRPPSPGFELALKQMLALGNEQKL